MGKYYNISIVGSGNVAWHLAKCLEDSGHSIVEVFSRNINNAELLCNKLYQATPKTDLDFSDSEAEILIIAVSDKAISSIIENLIIPPTTTIIHTSGTASLKVLQTIDNPCGILYPIQTFSKKRNINITEVPISIEASNKEVLSKVESLGLSLSKKIYHHTTEQRRVIHLAGVFAANFTNHMLTISKGLLESNYLDFELVKPLIVEVINKALELGPENSQTGPAIRNDYTTIEKHLDYLTEELSLTKIYKDITDDIIKTYED